MSITLIPVFLALSTAPGIVLDNQHGEKERDKVIVINLEYFLELTQLRKADDLYAAWPVFELQLCDPGQDLDSFSTHVKRVVRRSKRSKICKASSRVPDT